MLKPDTNKYKTMHDSVGKVIPCDVCETLIFDNAEQYYTRIPEALLEKLKIFWDLETQTDHPKPTERPDQVLIDKKNITCLVDVVVPTDQREKKTKPKKWPNIIIISERWIGCGSLGQRLYVDEVVPLELSLEIWKWDWGKWRSKEASKPFLL